MVSPTVRAGLLALLGVIVFLSSVGGLVYYNMTFEAAQVILRIPAGAQMLAIGVGVYWDITCTGPVTKVDWGSLSPGQSKNIVVYVRNEGNGPLTGTLSSNKWVPTGSSQYFTFTWDFGSSSLDASRVRKTTLTLYVHSDITGIDTFSFDIIITGASLVS